jgi:hypothetical protein
LAAENRLVVGGASGRVAGDVVIPAASEGRVPLLSGNGLSLGALSESGRSLATGNRSLAVGGYVAYGLSGSTSLMTSLRADSGMMTADISAGYSGSLLGLNSSAALHLGANWSSRMAPFSLNPMLPDPMIGVRPGASQDSVNLSLTLRHNLSPSFSVGGVAEAISPTGGDPGLSPGFRLGAGIGVQF